LSEKFPCLNLVQFSSPTLPKPAHRSSNKSERSILRWYTQKNECEAHWVDDCGEREREKKERILHVGAPIAVMHATIISTRCERLNITTHIHAEHLQLGNSVVAPPSPHGVKRSGGVRSLASVNYIPEAPSAINLGGEQ
jgi:hypothetical protein